MCYIFELFFDFRKHCWRRWRIWSHRSSRGSYERSVWPGVYWRLGKRHCTKQAGHLRQRRRLRRRHSDLLRMYIFWNIITSRNISCGKVIFSQASAIHSVNRVGVGVRMSRCGYSSTPPKGGYSSTNTLDLGCYGICPPPPFLLKCFLLRKSCGSRKQH